MNGRQVQLVGGQLDLMTDDWQDGRQLTTVHYKQTVRNIQTLHFIDHHRMIFTDFDVNVNLRMTVTDTEKSYVTLAVTSR